MCFTPQRRSLFRHLNFQKCSDTEVFLAFWLRNLLRAALACNFWSLSQLPRWLRTRRFGKPTFSSGATKHWKSTVFRGFSTFSRTCIFFLLTLSLFCSSLFYSSLLSDSSHLCFHLSISSEVWLLNFLRLYTYVMYSCGCGRKKRITWSTTF